MIWLALPAAAAGAYYLLASAGALLWFRRRARPAYAPPVSILKPVHGRDPRFFEAIRSHAEQDYPEFEILFGVRDTTDPALEDIRRLEREFPRCAIRVIPVASQAPNGKAGALIDLARDARHRVLLVNDSDIVVPPGYLSSVLAPLADPSIGLVTCLYRGHASSGPGLVEAVGIATEFIPSVLVGRMVGVRFALGASMAFRAIQLEEIGGFESIAGYLADDFQLGHRIAARGFRIELAPVVVETALGHESWAAAWRHQVRWSRTIRVSRRAGYYGYAVTHATVWSAVAALAGYWPVAAAAMAVRMISALLTGVGVLGDRKMLFLWPLVPVRDLWGFAVWLAGLAGTTIEWRGELHHLHGDGRIGVHNKA